MREAYAITGYVSNDVAKNLKANASGKVEVRPERGAQEVLMQVDGSHITEVRTGSSTGGETLVQLILRDEASVHTVIQSTAARGLQAFPDPTLARLTAAATAKKILV
jgi:hypothetical protein